MNRVGRLFILFLIVAIAVVVLLSLSGRRSGPGRVEGVVAGPPPAVRPPDADKAEGEAAEPSEPAVPAGMAPIELELPQPMFQGTPKPVNEPNMEEPLGKARPPFLAPEGTMNLALGKPVTSSDEWPIIGDVELVTDGDKEATQGSFVELGPGRQWVQIDLEQKAKIYAIAIWHYHAQARAYRDVVVQLGNDPDLVLDVETVFNNDHDNSSGLGVGEDKGYVETFEGKLVDCGGAEARYVRLYSNGNTADESNHYTEVEVYGEPVE
jgi:hypothetical protein